MRVRPPVRPRGGFTLLELLVGMAVGAVVLAAVAVAFVALQRSFEAANYQMTAQNDQLRVLDYLSRDLHMSTAVTVLNGGEKITATLPSSDSSLVQLNLGPLANSVQSIGTGGTATQTVSYYVEGGQLIREVNGNQLDLADTVAGVQFTQAGAYVNASFVFSPQFSTSPTTATQPSTRAESCIYLRNATSTH